MKLYHGKWNNNSIKDQNYIGEYNTEEEVHKAVYEYVQKNYGDFQYLIWNNYIAENNLYIVDYGSWSDFIFVTELNDEMRNMF